MEPDKKHSGYEKYQKVWERIRDFCDGEDAVKGRREEYLPKLPSQSESIIRGVSGKNQTLYDLFLEKATVWPGASKTIKAFTGILTRKQPEIEAPAELISVFSIKGEDVYTSATWGANELMKTGLGGYLIDYPEDAIRAYAVKYGARDILDWDYKIANGKQTLVFVSLVDKWYEGDPEKIVHLYINSEGIYTTEAYKKQDTTGKKKWVKVGEGKPMINNAFFGYIPFVPFSESGTILNYDYPMMTDVVNLNKAHYQNDAEYRNALTFAGRPTPCVAGLIQQEGRESVQLGTSTVLQFEEGGSWGMLGLDNASGIDAIRKAGEDLKRDMAVAGSKALQSDPAGIEAADTARIHREGEHGQLSTVAKVISDAMTKVLNIMAEWSGSKGDYVYRINTDFNPAKIDTQTLTTLWQMYASGDISWSTLYYNMQRGELTQDLKTAKQEREEADADAASNKPTIPMEFDRD